MKRELFVSFLLIYVAGVLWLAYATPVTTHEAKIYLNSGQIFKELLQLSRELFGYKFGIRVPSILFAVLDTTLFYLLSREYLEKKSDRYLALFIFLMLPGTIAAFVLLNLSVAVLALVLCIFLAYKKGNDAVVIISMLALFFIDPAAVFLFVTVGAYAFTQRRKWIFIFAISLSIAMIILHRAYFIGDKPSTHFLDLFALYAALFSPLVFIYFFYAHYRILIRGKKDLLWFVAFVAFVSSLLLSIRQKVYVTDFAPYLLPAIILMVKVYFGSLRVRLECFRGRYKIAFAVVMSSLILTALSIFSYPLTYRLMGEPNSHFAHRLYEAQKRVEKLKKGAGCFDENEPLKQKRVYRYFGLDRCF